MSNQFNASLLSFSVYETQKGELAIRLSSPSRTPNGRPFSHCGYLTGADGDFLFGSHPVLGPKWEAAKVQLARAKAGVIEPDYIQAQPAPVQVAPAAPAPEVKRGRGRPAGSKNRVTRVAETEVAPVAPAPVAPAPVAPQIDLNALAAQVNTLTQVIHTLLAPRK